MQTKLLSRSVSEKKLLYLHYTSASHSVHCIENINMQGSVSGAYGVCALTDSCQSQGQTLNSFQHIQ